MSPLSSGTPSAPFAFQHTRWSLVRRAAFRGHGDDADMEEFCRIYWYPLFAAARRFGQSPEDACDSVQALFASLLTKDTLRRADPERGRLRFWLLTLLQNQIRGESRAARTQKRGGGRVPFSLDSAAAEAAFAADPGLHEDPQITWRRHLATSLLDEAVEALAATYKAAGKEALFEALIPALEGPLPDSTWQEAAVRMGSTSSALRMAVVRLRDRFRKVLRAKAAVALGLQDGPRLDQELRELFSGGL